LDPEKGTCIHIRVKSTDAVHGPTRLGLRLDGPIHSGAPQKMVFLSDSGVAALSAMLIN
jgi:hypothetical protein